MPTSRSNESIVSISHLSKKGRGVSSDSKMEVVGALPTEEVVVECIGKSKRVRLAIAREIIHPATERVSPRCPHVPYCGGCSLQQMDYRAQLAWKESSILHLFRELIERDQTAVDPILACEEPWRYRNKMEFSFSQNRAGEKFLGLMLGGSKGKVFNVEECHIASDWSTCALEQIRNWWKETKLEAYYPPLDRGHLRTVTLRQAHQGVGKMAILTVSGNPQFAIKRGEMDRFVAAIKKTAPEEELSIFLQVHQMKKGMATQFFEMLLFGKDHITERIDVMVRGTCEQIHCKISPDSFFQPNTLQAQRFYGIGLEMLTHLEGGVLFDLYCGSGTIALSACRFAKEVVGIELNAHAVFDAKWNKEVNLAKNMEIYQGDVAEVMGKLREKSDFSSPDVVVVDPPRSGLALAMIKHLEELNPKEILYISCNPMTQVDNIALLTKGGYRLTKMQPIDQFPHTVHVENICLLEKA